MYKGSSSLLKYTFFNICLSLLFLVDSLLAAAVDVNTYRNELKCLARELRAIVSEVKKSGGTDPSRLEKCKEFLGFREVRAGERIFNVTNDELLNAIDSLKNSLDTLADEGKGAAAVIANADVIMRWIMDGSEPGQAEMERLKERTREYFKKMEGFTVQKSNYISRGEPGNSASPVKKSGG